VLVDLEIVVAAAEKVVTAVGRKSGGRNYM